MHTTHCHSCVQIANSERNYKNNATHGNIKKVGISLTKEVKDIYNQNYIILKWKLKSTQKMETCIFFLERQN